MRDLNPRPPRPERGTLPGCANPRFTEADYNLEMFLILPWSTKQKPKRGLIVVKYER
jgi:hypothetical protein